MNNKQIIFDMDGTIADLYSVPNWLFMLRNENPRPYLQAKPMWDMQELNGVLNKLKVQGWTVKVVTWLSKDSSESYKTKVRQAKKAWLDGFNFPYDNLHMVAYGSTKANAIRRSRPDYAILIDDNEQVCIGWTLGDTINPQTTNIINELKGLLN